MSETRDLGVHYDPQSSLNDRGPAIGLYDRIQGGLGFSKLLYKSHDRLMNQAFSIVKNCNCFDGCPSCVGPGGEFGSGSKKETLGILKELIRD
jgi:DEAD/DEAH box helicase domain-containing protein